ncbi:MAG: ATP-binding protein [Acidobacteriia bacterium]|nr:ATP-binding protein [Terriglobia bacterium]
MSIFSKPLSQIGSQDLAELLAEKAVENVRLEFKRDIPNKDETLKKLSSFANTYGGVVVVGAKANSSDGRIVGFPGVDIQSGYKQKVVQWCFDGAMPPLEVEVSDPIQIPSGNGRVCYVLFSPESENAPHFLNGRKGVYVRSDEFSSRFEPQLATENELRHLLDRRKLILERRAELLRRARRRFLTFTRRRYQELTKSKESIGCRFDLCVVPRFPARPVCDHGHLSSLLRSIRVDWRSVGFPRSSVGFISQHESEIVLRPGSSFSILEANIWGMIFYATEIERETEQYSGIHLNHFLGQLLVFLKHANLMLRGFGYVGPLLLEMKQRKICGVPWIVFDGNKPIVGRASELDDQVSFSISTTSEAMDKRRDGLVMDILRYVFFATDWSEVADSPQELEKLVRTGYQYNSWNCPSKLLV